ncbi:MAG: hypothetical protein JJ992_20440 [Planctomycetes bacterium]|nr:hypothetical protein [Planctomycetota bacterium]
MSGTIVSVDVGGAMSGVGDEDVYILYNDTMAGNGYSFDDLTPLNHPVPEPASLLTWAGLAVIVIGSRAGRWRALRLTVRCEES